MSLCPAPDWKTPKGRDFIQLPTDKQKEKKKSISLLSFLMRDSSPHNSTLFYAIYLDGKEVVAHHYGPSTVTGTQQMLNK